MVIIPGVEVLETRLAAICESTGSPNSRCSAPGPAGQAAPDSDIDSLYTLRPGRRLGWEIEQFADELAKLFGHEVDLVSRLHAREGEHGETAGVLPVLPGRRMLFRQRGRPRVLRC